MEPLSAAYVLSTIVGLICNYKNEKKAISTDEYQTFVKWLHEKHHTEIINYLEKNSLAVDSIKHFLTEDNKIILRKLEAIDNVTAKIASSIEGLAEIARAVKPNHGLSSQCINIIRQFNDSNGSHFSELKTGEHSLFMIVNGNSGNINYDEPRFIEDDLRTLLELKLLRLDRTNSGNRIFYLTREAASLL